MELDRDTDA